MVPVQKKGKGQVDIWNRRLFPRNFSDRSDLIFMRSCSWSHWGLKMFSLYIYSEWWPWESCRVFFPWEVEKFSRAWEQHSCFSFRLNVCCLSTWSFGTLLYKASQYVTISTAAFESVNDWSRHWNKLKNPSVKWENVNKTTYLSRNQKQTTKHFSDCGLSSHPGNVIYAHMWKDHLPTRFCAGEMDRQARPAGLPHFI